MKWQPFIYIKRCKSSNNDIFNHAPVAQLVEHRAAMQEVMSSTPAGPTLRVLK